MRSARARARGPIGRLAAGFAAGLIAVTTGLALGGPALADPAGGGLGVQEIDQSQLVPSPLDSSYAPFTCRMAPTGPVCTGENEWEEDWVQVDDFGCQAPIFNQFVGQGHSTRYYNHDGMLYLRKHRAHQTDYNAPDASLVPTSTISTNVRWTAEFDTPGDDGTFTFVSMGTLWDIRPIGGQPILRITGTLVEPHDGPATFTGHRMLDGVSTHYADAPLEDVLPDDVFLSAVCRATFG